METIPVWLNKTLSADDLKKITASVTSAERKTSGEIVPMIVRSSISTGHVETILFLGWLLFFWTLAVQMQPFIGLVPFWIFQLGAVVLAVIFAWALHGSTYWQRILTSPHDQAAAVMRRAQLEFYQSKIRASHRHTGVLVFVSLLERRAVILADEPVAHQIPTETWEAAIGALVGKVKEGDLAAGMCHAVSAVGAILTEKFPIHIGDRSELSNEPVIKE
jgi:putative membrane protein